MRKKLATGLISLALIAGTAACKPERRNPPDPDRGTRHLQTHSPKQN